MSDGVVLRCVLCLGRLVASQQVSVLVPCGHLLHTSCADHFMFQCREDPRICVTSHVNGRTMPISGHPEGRISTEGNFVELSSSLSLSVSPPRRIESSSGTNKCHGCACEVTGLFRKVFLSSRMEEGAKRAEGENKKIESRSKLVISHQEKNRRVQCSFNQAKNQVTFLQRKCAHLHAQIAINNNTHDHTIATPLENHELRLAANDANTHTLSRLPLHSQLTLLVETAEELRSTRTRAQEADRTLRAKKEELAKLKAKYLSLKDSEKKERASDSTKENLPTNVLDEPRMPSVQSPGKEMPIAQPSTVANNNASTSSSNFRKLHFPRAPGVPNCISQTGIVQQQSCVIAAPPSSPVLNSAVRLFGGAQSKRQRSMSPCCPHGETVECAIDVRNCGLSEERSHPLKLKTDSKNIKDDEDDEETTVLLQSSGNDTKTFLKVGSNRECPVNVDNEEDDSNAIIVLDEDDDDDTAVPLDVDECSSIDDSLSDEEECCVVMPHPPSSYRNHCDSVLTSKREGSLDSQQPIAASQQDEQEARVLTRDTALDTNRDFFMTTVFEGEESEEDEDDDNYLADFAATLLLPSSSTSSLNDTRRLPALGRSTGRSIRDLPKREDRLFQLEIKDLLSSD